MIPIAIPAKTAKNIFCVFCITLAAIVPVSATTDPKETSMCPKMIINVTPKASKLTTTNCLKTLVKFAAFKKNGLANDAKITIVININIVPYFLYTPAKPISFIFDIT